MYVVIDMMGEEETLVVSDDPTGETPALSGEEIERIRQEIASRTPALQIVPQEDKA